MFKDWKTTSAGLLMIIGGIVTVIFSVMNNTLTEAIVMTAITAILGGIGLLFAKDSTPPTS